MIESITSTCGWCETKETFDGEDPEKDWREAGWLTFINEDETDYCSLGCAISALN